MKTVKIKIYKFAELSELAKSKVIEKLSDINVNYDWWESTYEDAERIGLKITGFDLEHATGRFLLSACEVTQNIFNEHGENCETYKTAVKFLKEWQPVFDDYMNEHSEKYESSESENELQSLEDDFLHSLLEDYSIMLQHELEYLQTDVAIIETIERNDFWFKETGEIYIFNCGGAKT